MKLLFGKRSFDSGNETSISVVTTNWRRNFAFEFFTSWKQSFYIQVGNVASIRKKFEASNLSCNKKLETNLEFELFNKL